MASLIVFIFCMVKCTLWFPIPPFWIQLLLPFSGVSPHCWAIHLQAHSFPPSHTLAFYLQMGTLDSKAFCVQMCPVIINKLQLPGREEGRKNKGCTIVYLHWQQPSKHRYIKTRPEEQWLCHQEQGTYGTQCFIVGLFPLEGHIYHLKLDKTFPWQMQVKVTHSNLPKLAFCWIWESLIQVTFRKMPPGSLHASRIGAAPSGAH